VLRHVSIAKQLGKQEQGQHGQQHGEQTTTPVQQAESDSLSLSSAPRNQVANATAAWWNVTRKSGRLPRLWLHTFQANMWLMLGALGKQAGSRPSDARRLEIDGWTDL
jgi:hypothetical protein